MLALQNNKGIIFNHNIMSNYLKSFESRLSLYPSNFCISHFGNGTQKLERCFRQLRASFIARYPTPISLIHTPAISADRVAISA